MKKKPNSATSSLYNSLQNSMDIPDINNTKLKFSAKASQFEDNPENTIESYLEFLFMEGLKAYFGYEGTQKDYAKARNFFEMATKNGHGPSKFFLGDMYWMGFGVEQDCDRGYSLQIEAAPFALTCFEKMAQDKPDGDKNIMYQLGMIYYEAYGVEKNYEKAFHYYKLAAERNHIGAQFLLGKCYEKGAGTEKNVKLAIFWYNKSAQSGLEISRKALEKLNASSPSKSITPIPR